MNTVEFLDLILPEDGYRVVTVIAPGRAPIQKFFETNEKAADAILKLDQHPTVAVYHACASYKTTQSRLATNVQSVKAYWLDIDVGPGKGYATRDEALAAVKSFAADTHLWNPFVIVSGKGLHVYWVLEQPVDPTTWLQTASLLKGVCGHYGLAAGPERTADIASVLRPVGTTHRKNGTLPVTLLDVGNIAPSSYMHMRLEEYAQAHGLETGETLGPRPDYIGPADNSILSQTENYPTPTVAGMLEGCAAMREWAATGASHIEPFWRAGLGVLRHCKGGREFSHEISAQYKGYSHNATEKKIDGIQGGATQCSTFHAHVPAICEACPHWSKQRSPMVAATYETPTLPPSPVLEAKEPDAIPPFPRGYRWDDAVVGGGMLGSVQDKETKSYAEVRFSKVLFYPTTKYRTDEGVVLRMRAHIKPTETVEFDLPTQYLADSKKLLSRLAANEITPVRGQGALMVAYIDDFMGHLRSTLDAAKARTQYGWTENNDFIIGNTMYSKGGKERSVVLVGTADSIADSFTPRGDLQTWKDLIDRAYNHPYLEGFQFAVLSGLAAPLVRLFNDYGGLLVYLYAGTGGQGKTSVERAALSAWCEWRGQQQSEGSTTSNAFFKQLGTVSNMPIVYDELTNLQNDAAGRLVHTISQGNPKNRMKATLELVVGDARWETIVLASGNMLLSEKIAQHRAQNDAERARIFEYEIEKPYLRDARGAIVMKDGQPQPLIPPTEAMRLFPLFAEHYGHAGRVIARYLVDNYDDVKARLYEAQDMLATRFKLQQHERYWTVLLACNVTMLQIARELDLIQFPIAPMMAWIKKTLEHNRGSAVEAHVDQSDILSQMVHALYGQCIVTQGQGDPYSGVDAYIEQDPRGPEIVGRVITQRPGPLGQLDTPTIYLAASACKTWCNKHGVSYSDIFRDGVKAGTIVSRTEKAVRLGHGTRKYATLGTVKCLQVDPSAVKHAIGVPQSQPLTVIPGGKKP